MQSAAFGLQDLKTKTRYTDVLNGSKQEIRQYLDAKKQENNYEPRISSLKCNQQCTPDVFRDGNKSSKVLLVQLKISNHGQKCG